MFRLYVKFPEDKRYRPVDWNASRCVGNLIYATLFTSDEVKILKKDLAHPANSGFEWQIREVK